MALDPRAKNYNPPLNRCHAFAYRLAYLRRKKMRKICHAYFVAPRYVANMPRCNVLFCVHLKICSMYVAGLIPRTYVTIRGTYESDMAGTS